jgi:hypothetical protein
MKITKDLIRKSVIRLASDGDKLAMVMKVIDSFNIEDLKETFIVIDQSTTRTYLKRIMEESKLKIEALEKYEHIHCNHIIKILDKMKEIQCIMENINEPSV